MDNGFIFLLFEVASSQGVPFTSHSMYNTHIMDLALSSFCAPVVIYGGNEAVKSGNSTICLPFNYGAMFA